VQLLGGSQSRSIFASMAALNTDARRLKPRNSKMLDRELTFAIVEKRSKPWSTSLVILQFIHGLVRRNERMSCISVSAILTFSDGNDRPDSSTHHHYRRYQSWDSLEPQTGLFDHVASLVSLVRGLQENNGAPHGVLVSVDALSSVYIFSFLSRTLIRASTHPINQAFMPRLPFFL
jgi:hypothetical protein